MAARKAPAKKVASGSKNDIDAFFTKQPYTSSSRKKKSAAGDLGSERSAMRRVAKVNNDWRKNQFGSRAFTYRGKDKKLGVGTANVRVVNPTAIKPRPVVKKTTRGGATGGTKKK